MYARLSLVLEKVTFKTISYSNSSGKSPSLGSVKSWRRAMKLASALDSAEENDEKEEKRRRESSKQQPEACILERFCRWPPPWIGPRLLIEVRDKRVNE